MPSQLPESLPEFDLPPLVEVVLSAQFDPLDDFATAHAGRFWGELDRQQWVKAADAHALPETFERFGEDRKWAMAPSMRVSATAEANRTQIVNGTDDEMLQVQSSRFVFNWRKRAEAYPSFRTLLPRFLKELQGFTSFVRTVRLGDVKLNQWEVVYVNHLPRDELWETPRDWKGIFPSIDFPAANLAGHEPEALSAEWSVVLHGNRGRLHTSLKLARLGVAEGPEVLVLQLVARGPVSSNQGFDLESGLKLGHSSIVLAFDAMTSRKAHEHWRKRTG